MFAAGLVFVVLWFMGSIGAALPLAFEYSEEVEITDIDTLRVLLILGGHWFPGASASTASVVVGGASFVAWRHHPYRRWLAWAGLVIAVLMLPSIVFFAGLTLVGLMVWTASVGVWLARGTPDFPRT